MAHTETQSTEAVSEADGSPSTSTSVATRWQAHDEGSPTINESPSLRCGPTLTGQSERDEKFLGNNLNVEVATGAQMTKPKTSNKIRNFVKNNTETIRARGSVLKPPEDIKGDARLSNLVADHVQPEMSNLGGADVNTKQPYSQDTNNRKANDQIRGVTRMGNKEIIREQTSAFPAASIGKGIVATSSPPGGTAPSSVENDTPEIGLSVGSALHASLQCRPCAWFHKPQGCENGTECRHCHACQKGEIRLRRKLKVARLKGKQADCEEPDEQDADTTFQHQSESMLAAAWQAQYFWDVAQSQSESLQAEIAYRMFLTSSHQGGTSASMSPDLSMAGFESTSASMRQDQWKQQAKRRATRPKTSSQKNKIEPMYVPLDLNTF